MSSISVISTVYNGKRYLEDYFLSIHNQTFTDYELILIDDGSIDGSGEICDDHAKKDSRIKVVHQNNQGLAAARNTAVKLTNSEWITFVDCDDVVHPRYLEILYEGIIRYNVSISGVGVFETKEIPLVYKDDIDDVWGKYLITENFLMEDICGGYFGQIAAAKLIHKDLLIKSPFTNGRVFEDNAVVKKWVYNAGTIAYCDECLYFYRINNTGLSKGDFNARKVEDVLWARDEIINFYKQKGLKKAYSQAEQNYILFAINLYFKLRKIDKENAEKLKKRTIARYRRDKEFIDFSKENKLFIFELEHPKLMWLYWMLNRIIKRK